MRRVAVILALYTMAVAAIVGVPWYLAHVAPWQQQVLSVHGEVFTIRDVAERLRSSPATDPAEGALEASFRMLETIARERLILREAEQRGLVPSAEEVRRLMASRIGETSASMNDQDRRLEALRRAAGLTEAEQVERFRLRRAASALAAALAETDGDAVPVIHLTGAAFDDRQTAEAVARAAREAGDLAAVLAAGKLPGGDLGWTPKGADDGSAMGQVQVLCGDTRTWLTLEQARERFPGVDWQAAAPGADVGTCTVTARIPGGRLIDEIAFRMPVGAVSPPLLTEEGFLVLQVLGTATRKVSPQLAEQLQRSALERWTGAALAEARAAGEIRFNWDSDALALLQERGPKLP